MGRVKLDINLYNQAREKNITFSQLLEQMDPVSESSLTAYERQLKEHGILCRSVPEKGIWSSCVEAFYRTNESKVLFPEFVATQARESIQSDSILPYLIATTTPINSDTHRTFKVLNDDKNKKSSQLSRVSEGSEFPTSELKSNEEVVKIYKYGKAIKATYEAIRRMRIDMLSLHLRRISLEAAKSQTNDLLQVIRNGDGNNGTAAPVLKNKSLDATSSSRISRESFMKFLLRFWPYKCDVLIADEVGVIQILDILFPDSSSQMADTLLRNMRLNIQIKMPQGLFENLTLLYWPELEKVNGNSAVIGIDSRYTIEKVYEIGSDTLESQKFITNQTEILAISEISGFSKFMNESNNFILEID